ncbi:MAG: GyrI-like domain-containing protein [Planctomycetota bacterium]|nr:GyrI-like domain-containing protein [Planctomycetota bacterium]
MPHYAIKRSILIDAPAEQVFDTVADFATWPTWSPWLQIDPKVALNYTGKPGSLNAGYQWTGEIVGQGEMQHFVLNRPRRIEDNLRFIEPVNSRADISFDFESVDHSTKVTWQMTGKLPWFLFWLKPTITMFISMDYDRGLKMLKEFVETGEVLSELEVLGTEIRKEIHVLGVRDSAAITQIGPVTEKALQKVDNTMQSFEITPASGAISIYHPVNLKRGRFEFTTFPVSLAVTPPSGLQCIQIPAGKFLRVRHTSSYDNLGNAWSGIYQYARARKLKIAKRDGFEIYRNHPKETPLNELVTDVYVPLKSSK